MEYAEKIESECLALLKEQGMTFSSAESCTGGLIAKRITDLAGSSSVFAGTVVSYTNEVKANVLGVPKEVIDAHGAVSEIVARAMAENVRRLMKTDIGVSTTGVAGPDKDDRGNDVGTVYIALATEKETLCRKMEFGDRGRNGIREQAASTAFDMIRRALRGLDPLREK